jgi:hypothetical protein
MPDRPTLSELIAAARGHLEAHVIPTLKASGDQRLYFQTLVAANVLAIAEREIAHSRAHLLQDWALHDQLDSAAHPLPDDPQAVQAALAERDARLAAAIRAGAYDDDPRLLDLLIARTTRALEIANPRLLLTLIAEMGQPS